MKQVIQSLQDGEPAVRDVPVPNLVRDGILVAPSASLVSAGTERMVVEFSEKNLWQKARSRPDLVRQTVDKAKREGILTTLDAVRNRLGQPVPLGYSCAGRVLDVSPGVAGFGVGDRVACAGGGYAVHAEVVTVPKNLAVKLPENVDFDSAAFCTLGAIALQAARLAEAKLGEVVAVIGLGLIGQLAVQILKAAGCNVVGMDIQRQRAELALRLGADAAVTTPEEFSAICRQVSAGHGADAVLIAADTKSNRPVELAGEVAREKGVVVAVGAVSMNIPRKIYYEKELDFRISRSYGPGRHDINYEEKGHDYPYAYVRWTEQRNIEAFARMLSDGKADVQPLITHRFPIEDAPRAYELIKGKSGEPFLGVVLTYSGLPDLSRRVSLQPGNTPGHTQDAVYGRNASPVERVRLGVIGGGNFANGVLLPAAKKSPSVDLVGLASGSGLSARSTAERFGFAYCSTSTEEVIADPAVNAVAILTRHHLHARQVVAALKAGKHVFVEKPLCLNQEELSDITSAYGNAGGVDGRRNGDPPASASPYLMVGFNRRFAPFVIELKEHLARVQEPLMMYCRVNAGFIPPHHWTQDPAQGGGRLLGEACHFIDLLIHLSGSVPLRVTTRALPDGGRYVQDNLLITLEFADGSLGAVTYAANGHKGAGKEFLEVSGGGLSGRLDDYRTLFIRHGNASIKRIARLRQDKGHRAEFEALVAHLAGGVAAPISFDEIILSTRATLAAHDSLRTGEPVTLAVGSDLTSAVFGSGAV